ncbi:hypothetical protein KI387_001293 [Taxus chinensis]|uniref:AP2/ERF domain-containing protein n=1 Tax=Taxus chinensis TaxID=29808 RepID=A0AA38GWK0_TAXCH|nr:hypothetical protein KI387_001293 [Taxus chinensis]
MLMASSTERLDASYRRVRKRPWDRFTAKIPNPVKKLRVWLSTFDIAEDAAMAYDATVISLRGGGFAGVALALSIQERNVEAYVFEMHPYFRSDTATGIGIGPNGAPPLKWKINKLKAPRGRISSLV